MYEDLLNNLSEDDVAAKRYEGWKESQVVMIKAVKAQIPKIRTKHGLIGSNEAHRIMTRMIDELIDSECEKGLGAHNATH